MGEVKRENGGKLTDPGRQTDVLILNPGRKFLLHIFLFPLQGLAALLGLFPASCVPQASPQGARAALPEEHGAVLQRLASRGRCSRQTVPPGPRRAARFLPLRGGGAGAEAAGAGRLPSEEAGLRR